MSDYKAVQDSLGSGADPAVLCAICPWDRYCVTPPTMTRADIDQRLKEADAQDKAREADAVVGGKPAAMPVHSLMTALVFAGRDTQAGICPVFALRLRTGGGRRIADAIKSQMQGWDES